MKMYCPSCGSENADTARFCAKCGVPFIPQAVQSAQPQLDPALKWLIPIGRSGFAIASGYLALFSVLLAPVWLLGMLSRDGVISFWENVPVFLITLSPAPFALLFGILARSDIKKHPEKSGLGRARFGIVAGGLCLILFAVLFLLRIAD